MRPALVKFLRWLSIGKHPVCTCQALHVDMSGKHVLYITLHILVMMSYGDEDISVDGVDKVVCCAFLIREVKPENMITCARSLFYSFDPMWWK